MSHHHDWIFDAWMKWRTAGISEMSFRCDTCTTASKSSDPEAVMWPLQMAAVTHLLLLLFFFSLIRYQSHSGFHMICSRGKKQKVSSDVASAVCYWGRPTLVMNRPWPSYQQVLHLSVPNYWTSVGNIAAWSVTGRHHRRELVVTVAKLLQPQSSLSPFTKARWTGDGALLAGRNLNVLWASVFSRQNAWYHWQVLRRPNRTNHSVQPVNLRCCWAKASHVWFLRKCANLYPEQPH